MAESGIEFGSHGNDHVHFDLLGEQEVLNELTVSKNTIETIINKQVYSVAYPFGSYNETTMKMANKAGYKFGTTTNSGDNRLVDDFELCRFAVKGYALKHYWYFCKTLKNITKN
jgi:peptidoglycan/xylan/chitin deacetylase (PgdA/CDA1 family)